MIKTSPDMLDSFTYEGQKFLVEWFEVETTNDLPDVAWQQVYAVANADGLVGLIYNAKGIAGLPGGKTEAGETIEETLVRELEEEMNYRVLDWRPIGYQKVTDEAGDSVFQARLYAEVQKIADFVVDPAGSVVGQKFVALSQLNDEIQYGKVGDRIMELVAADFSLKS